MRMVRGIRWTVAWPAVLLAILLAGCHSSARSIRKNPRVEQFDYQISVGQDQYHIEGYLARAPQPGREPALLVINPSGDAVKCIKSSLQLTLLELNIACISLPGTGKSSGPGRYVGPQAVAAARRAIDLLSQRADVDPDRLGVWGVANVEPVRGGAAHGRRPASPCGHSAIGHLRYDQVLARDALVHQVKSILHQVWPSRRVAFKERSVIDQLPARLKCKVLILHGEEDKRNPLRQAEQLAWLLAAGTWGLGQNPAIFPTGTIGSGPRAYDEVVEFLRANLVLGQRLRIAP